MHFLQSCTASNQVYRAGFPWSEKTSIESWSIALHPLISGTEKGVLSVRVVSVSKRSLCVHIKYIVEPKIYMRYIFEVRPALSVYLLVFLDVHYLRRRCVVMCQWIQRVQRWRRLVEGSCPQVAVKKFKSWSTGWHRVATSKPRCCARAHTLQLTLMRCHQQIQRLLGEIGPDSHHLFPQFCIHLVLVNTTYGHMQHMHACTSTYTDTHPCANAHTDSE